MIISSNLEPFVFIGIPVFNGEQFIIETLESINAQIYKNIKLVKIDDCSTDNSFEIVKNLSEHKKWVTVKRNKKNCGLIKTCNILLEQVNIFNC